MSLKEFGARLRRIREAAGVTIYRVEKDGGIDRRNLSAIELGNRPCSDENLQILSTLYGYPFDHLKALKLFYKLTPRQAQYLRLEICTEPKP